MKVKGYTPHQVNELLRQAQNAILKGKPRHQVTAVIRNEEGLKESVALRIYNEAVRLIRATVQQSQDLDRAKDMILARLGELYDAARTDNKYGVCNNILKNEAELLGITSTPVGAGSLDTDSIKELQEIANGIKDISEKGIGAVIDEAIRKATDQ